MKKYFADPYADQLTGASNPTVLNRQLRQNHSEEKQQKPYLKLSCFSLEDLPTIENIQINSTPKLI